MFKICQLNFSSRVISLTLFSVLTSSAIAASFDCAKARTPQERFICDNSEVSEADKNMGEAYRRARLQISLKGYVAADQKKWLASDYKECGNFGAGNKDRKKMINLCVNKLSARVIELDLMAKSSIYTNYEGDFQDGEDQGTLQLFEKDGFSSLKFIGGAFSTPTHNSYCRGIIDLTRQSNKFYEKDDEDKEIFFELKASEINLRKPIYSGKCDGPHGGLPKDVYRKR